jgi:hypothetical protein
MNGGILSVRFYLIFFFSVTEHGEQLVEVRPFLFGVSSHVGLSLSMSQVLLFPSGFFVLTTYPR